MDLIGWGRKWTGPKSSIFGHASRMYCSVVCFQLATFNIIDPMSKSWDKVKLVQCISVEQAQEVCKIPISMTSLVVMTSLYGKIPSQVDIR